MHAGHEGHDGRIIKQSPFGAARQSAPSKVPAHAWCTRTADAAGAVVAAARTRGYMPCVVNGSFQVTHGARGTGCLIDGDKEMALGLIACDEEISLGSL